MNNSVNSRDLTWKAMAGLAGGALGWLPVELTSAGHSITEQVTSAEAVAMFVSMAILSGMIGAMILASDEQKLEITPRVRNLFIRGFAICFLLALPANYYSNYVFSYVLSSGGWGLGHPGSIFYLMLGRIASWTLMGTMLGAGVGIASFRPVNLAKGAIGGLIGGFLGGFIFDPINRMTGGGLPSRLIGLSLIGLAIGLLIGLVQELTKTAWMTVEAGRLRGRQYRLEGAVSSIGRAEENPVGLFGDPAVQARHAVIERKGNDYVLRGLAVADGTFLNGERVESAPLKEGDRIRIGSYELSFHLRKGPAVRVESGAPRAYAPAPPAAPRPAPAVTGPSLVEASGQVHALRAGAETRLGRALDNDIVVGHSSVSRHHASIVAHNGSFMVRDLGSQNGTFVAGQRVSESALRDGDAVRLGEASFTFRA